MRDDTITLSSFYNILKLILQIYKNTKKKKNFCLPNAALKVQASITRGSTISTKFLLANIYSIYLLVIVVAITSLGKFYTFYIFYSSSLALS